jgi:hypothetical protein
MATAIYLTLLAGPVVPLPVPKIVLDALTEAEVTTSAGSPSGFRLSFTLSNKSPLHAAFLVAAGQTPLLRVIVVLTINGIPQVLMDGVTTNHEVTPGSKPGESNLSIIGEDLTKVMDLVDFSGIPYPGMPPEARVALIIAKYAVFGMIPLVIPSLFMDVPIPVDRLPKHQGTDLSYVRRLASEAGYVFYLDAGPAPGTNTAYWGPEIKVGAPQPALNLDMDGHTNVESLRFNFRTANTTLPVVFIQNQLTKVPIPIPIPNVNPLQPPLGLIPAPITNVNLLRDTANKSPMAAISRGLAEAARSADAVSGSGSLDAVRYGRLLKARGLVGVRGAGPAFNGLYFVSSVTTTIKRGEVKQSFQLARNGLVSITPRVPV